MDRQLTVFCAKLVHISYSYYCGFTQVHQQPLTKQYVHNSLYADCVNFDFLSKILLFSGTYALKSPIAFVNSVSPSVYQCLSVSLHVSDRLPLDGFPWNFVLKYFKKICWENTNLVEVRRKYLALCKKTWVHCIVVGEIKFIMKALCSSEMISRY
jgi:hypothetical protein